MNHIKKTILVVFGTRPEVIKLASVVRELRRQTERYDVLVCNTEQQKELSNQTLSYFGLTVDFNLNVMRPNQSLVGLQSQMLMALDEIYRTRRIDATIVQGDTMSVFCASLVSFYARVPIFHVEAGLRSYDLGEPFPEEALRQMTTRIAALNLAPTQRAVSALLKEAVAKESVILTGNTVIDALSCISDSVLTEAERTLRERGVMFGNEVALVTVHRRENHGERLGRILDAVVALALTYPQIQFVLPVHPNPNVHDRVFARLGGIRNVVLTSPLDYPELVLVMKMAKLVMTDSGGIQEEAPTFGVPVLVLRYETERMEGVEAGFAKLVGADTERIRREASDILSRSFPETRLDSRRNPYGDGNAAARIVRAIDDFFVSGDEGGQA